MFAFCSVSIISLKRKIFYINKNSGLPQNGSYVSFVPKLRGYRVKFSIVHLAFLSLYSESPTNLMNVKKVRNYRAVPASS